jgi:hypothetical protein
MHSYISDEYFDFITTKPWIRKQLEKFKTKKERGGEGLNQ